LSVQLQTAARDDQDAGGSEHVEAPDRFSVTRIDDEWTVWDAELRRHLVHEKVWDETTAGEVRDSLRESPNYVSVWDWSAPWA
jgi:hypothetical protein